MTGGLRLSLEAQAQRSGRDYSEGRSSDAHLRSRHPLGERVAGIDAGTKMADPLLDGRKPVSSVTCLTDTLGDRGRSS